MPDANKELVRRYFEELFNDRDFDVADKLMAEDYLEHAQAPFSDREPGRVNGPQATRETVRWLCEQFPDMRMTIQVIVAEGDIVVARVLSQGTNLGKINGVIPATGRSFEARQSHWFRTADGKLAEHWVTREDLVMMRQLGVIPPRPALVARLIWSQAQRVIRRR